MRRIDSPGQRDLRRVQAGLCWGVAPNCARRVKPEIMSREPVILTRDVDAAVVPVGTKVTLMKGETVYITQSLGGTYTTGLMVLADRYPMRHRGMAIGLFIASTSLGYAVSLMLSGLTISMGGYKLSFWVTCMGPFFGCLLAWITLWETKIHIMKRSRKEKYLKDMFGNRPAMLYVGV